MNYGLAMLPSMILISDDLTTEFIKTEHLSKNCELLHYGAKISDTLISCITTEFCSLSRDEKGQIKWMLKFFSTNSHSANLRYCATFAALETRLQLKKNKVTLEPQAVTFIDSDGCFLGLKLCHYSEVDFCWMVAGSNWMVVSVTLRST